MKHFKNIVVHGVQFVRYLKGHAPDSEVALTERPLAAVGLAARALLSRQVEAFEEGGGDFLSPLISGGVGAGDFMTDFEYGDVDMEQIMENAEQCGIDIDDMMTKAMGAFLLYGSDIDVSSPGSFGLDQMSPILLALKDDDEMECSAEDSAKIMSAFEGYGQCSGMSDFFNLNEIESGDLMQSIEDDCKPVYDTFLDTSPSLAYMEAARDEGSELVSNSQNGKLIMSSELNEQGEVCLKALLGDNAIGNFIRYEYNNMDKTFQCFSQLSEDLPHCVISTPVQDSGTISLPLSLYKKFACLVGSSYKSFLDEACVGLYEGLDDCLPQIEDYTDASDAIPFSCDEDIFLGMDESVVTGNKLPAFCLKTYDEKNIEIEELLSRFDHYNSLREHGWTIETTSNDPKDEVVEAISAPAEGEEEDEAPEEYKSDEADVLSVEAVEWADGEAASDDGSAEKESPFPLFLVAAAVVVVAMAVALVVKHRRASSESVVRKNYGDLALDVDDHEMA